MTTVRRAVRRALAAAAPALLAVLLAAATATAGVEQIAPADGRIALRVDGALAVPQRYLRQSGPDALCESAGWDGAAFFGEVTYCQAIGDRFWRRGQIGIDLLLARFDFLGDFIVAPLVPYRDVETALGTMTLHAFEIEDVPGRPSACNGFVRGAGSSGTGYREFLVGYVCADRGGLDDARTDALLRGLSIEGAFGALLP